MDVLEFVVVVELHVELNENNGQRSNPRNQFGKHPNVFLNWEYINDKGSILGLLRYQPLLYAHHNPIGPKKFLRTSKQLLKQNFKIVFVILYKIAK